MQCLRLAVTPRRPDAQCPHECAGALTVFTAAPGWLICAGRRPGTERKEAAPSRRPGNAGPHAGYAP